jgi:geranylgeranyl diphosphate synthase type II
LEGNSGIVAFSILGLMEADPRIEVALDQVITKATAAPCPAHLAEAIRYAVFPGGGRVRPGLCLAVAKACGDRWPDLANAAAVAIELLHCASLVQDDLPCFDDAPVRRGQPSLHMHFGEAVAILVGDALIVMAFSAVSAHVAERPAACAEILRALADAAGAPAGIAAGQAWESEPSVDVTAYHHAKTAALFQAAAIAGAVASGGEPAAWRQSGALLGAAYQVADDLADALGLAGTLGKPTHQDGTKARPNIVASLGIEGSIKRLDEVLGQSMQSIPECPSRASVEEFLRITGRRLCPPELRQKSEIRSAKGSL